MEIGPEKFNKEIFIGIWIGFQLKFFKPQYMLPKLSKFMEHSTIIKQIITKPPGIYELCMSTFASTNQQHQMKNKKIVPQKF